MFFHIHIVGTYGCKNTCANFTLHLAKKLHELLIFIPLSLKTPFLTKKNITRKDPQKNLINDAKNLDEI
jgi:hypothetical protein